MADQPLTNDDVARSVVHALRQSREVRAVHLVGSRARGDANPLSDWDFRVVVSDFPAVEAELPRLVLPLSPVAAEWDRLSEEQCYMLLLRGPAKVDLIFDEPHTFEPAWQVTSETLAPIDAHFWDWTLWLAAKWFAGSQDLVEVELEKMSQHLLAPMGVAPVPKSIDEAIVRYVAARTRLEEHLDVEVPRAAEREVMLGLRRD